MEDRGLTILCGFARDPRSGSEYFTQSRKEFSTLYFLSSILNLLSSILDLLSSSCSYCLVLKGVAATTTPFQVLELKLQRELEIALRI